MKNTVDPERLMRPHLHKLVPYSSARHEFTGAANVMLDANEHPGPSPAGGALNHYPDPGQHAVKASLAAITGRSANDIFIGNGSDEAIDLLVRIFCSPGVDAIITCPPTYGMYGVCAAAHDVDELRIPLRPDFSLDVPAILRAADSRTKLLFLCSPNNPTGNCLPLEQLLELAENFPGMVVVDEAYAEFASAESALNWAKDQPNVVVLRTLSKAWGSAGLRVGMAYAVPRVIALFNLLKPPYNVGAPAQEAALRTLADPAKTTAHIALSNAERERLRVALSAMPGTTVFPSDANFLLVRFPRAGALFGNLQQQGIVVRDRSKEPGCKDCLRITIGTPAENDLLLQAIRNLPA